MINICLNNLGDISVFFNVHNINLNNIKVLIVLGRQRRLSGQFM